MYTEKTKEFLGELKQLYQRQQEINARISSKHPISSHTFTLNYEAQCGSRDEFFGVVYNTWHISPHTLGMRKLRYPTIDTYIPMYHNTIPLGMETLTNFGRELPQHQRLNQINDSTYQPIFELQEIFENELLPFYDVHQIYIDLTKNYQITSYCSGINDLYFSSNDTLVAHIIFETNEKYVVGVAELLKTQIQTMIDIITEG